MKIIYNAVCFDGESVKAPNIHTGGGGRNLPEKQFCLVNVCKIL